MLMLAALPAGATFAQTAGYPARPIRVLLPVGAGGGMDYVARTVVTRLTDGLGQVLVIDNRPGAGGDIAMELAARAAPDGYTLIMTGASFIVRANVYKVTYDPLRDFTGVSQIAAAPYVLVVHASLPVKSVAELIAHAKSNPEKLNYATPGSGSLSHLATEWYSRIAGIRMVHVPYKGLGAAFTDLLAGQVQVSFASIPASMPHAKSQRLRALAVTGAERSKIAPALPTMLESGITGFEVTQWQGLIAPARTPAPIVNRLHREIANVLNQPESAARLAADGSEPIGSAPLEFARFIRDETAKWVGVIKQVGIRAD